MIADKSAYLKEGIYFLRSVKDHRVWLLKHDKSRISSQDYAIEQIRILENALDTIKDADKMKSFLCRKHSALLILINAKHKKRINQLRELIQTDFI